MQKGKLNKVDEECLRKNFLNLEQNIEALRLVDRFYPDGVITLDDKERIENKKTKNKRNDTVLHIILDSGPEDNFDKFIVALSIDYSHLDIVKSRLPKECKENSNQLQTFKHCKKLEQLIKLFDISALLIGESQCGKTSTLKTFGRFNNKHKRSIVKMREEKDLKIRLSIGRKIHLADSPSIKHFRPNSQNLIYEVEDSIQSVSEGFNAFLLIIKYIKVIKKEDLEIVETIKSLYGPDILKNYCILIVTHGDKLKAENESFKEWYLKQGKEFQNLYEVCGRRAIVVDNTIEDNDKVKDILIETIDDLQFKGRRYTADHFKKAESGRKRMLIEEKITSILGDTAAKCTSMIQFSREILETKGFWRHSVSEDNCKKLGKVYEESLDLMEKVQMMDEGTSILKNSLSLIKNVQGLLSDKMKFLNAKKTEKPRLFTTLEQEEKKLLKKIDRVSEKLRDEEEKYALKQEVMQLRETCNIIKHKSQCSDLEFESRHLKAKQIIELEQSMIKKPQTNVQLQMQAKYRDHNKQSKTKKCVWLSLESCICIFLLLLICLVYKGNHDSYTRNKNYFWTGLDSESFLIQFINKKTTMQMKENKRMIDNNMKIVLHNHNKQKAVLERLNQQQILLIKTNEILQQNVTELRAELNKLRNDHERYVLLTSTFLEYCRAEMYY